MRHFTILIGNETQGPLTEDALLAMIADGTVNADTRCAPVGTTEWVPLSAHFNFGSKLKVNLGKQVSTEAENAAATTRIDPDLRKKLLIYGLADSATVDGFTQIQATTAVSAKERLLSSQIRAHRMAKIATFVLAVPLAFAAGLFAPFVPTALGLLVSSGVHEEGSAKADLARCYQEIKQMRASVSKVEALVFEKPQGGTPLSDVLLNRLKVPPENSFFLKAKFGDSRVREAVTRAGGKFGKDRKVHLLKEMPSARTLELLKVSEQTLLTPLSGPQNWANFYANDGRELERLIQQATLKTEPAAKDGSFDFLMIQPINTSMSTQVVIELSINGHKAFASWSATAFDQGDWQAEPLPPPYFVTREEYLVTKKITTGDKPLKAVIGTKYRRFEIRRTSPTWRYLAIARKDDSDTLFLQVDEARFATAKIGDKLDLAKEQASQCFIEPAESPTPNGLESP